MTNGRIEEVGTYTELLNQDGSFANFLSQCLEQSSETESDEGASVVLFALINFVQN